VDCLVDALVKYGGEIKLGAHVEEILINGDDNDKDEPSRAHGVRVRYKSGKRGVVRAKQAVVSNASAWDTEELLGPKTKQKEEKEEKGKQTTEEERKSRWQKERADFERCPSFMHLHLGIDASKLPASKRDSLEIHHIWVGDWSRGIAAPQNCVLVSIPSVLDPSLAPPGKHVVHAYTPGNEPYELWEGMDRRSDEYKQMKEERAQVLWNAVDKALGLDSGGNSDGSSSLGAKDLAEVSMVGTPLTHERFLRRKRGTYGPALRADAQGNQTLPFARTSIDNLLCTGDSTFPGIGLPAVAASGMLAANSLVTVEKHLDMLGRIGLLD
jgi:phytoene dehydrogenase-like protein